MIDDKRTSEQIKKTVCMVVATDSFMSGWGQSPGKSYFAVPCESFDQAKIVEDNMHRRSEMKRVRIVGVPYRPRLGRGDHLSIRKMSDCNRFYTPNGF